MSEIKFIEFIFNKQAFNISIIINIWALAIIVIVFFILKVIFYYFRKSSKIHKDVVPVKLKYSYGGAEIEYEIIRNYNNVEIAHKMYIELITRKAAIKIDENFDVIVEVYNSWYSIFQITRDELKKIPGKLLTENNTSNALVNLLTDILNKGLRPHLTTYQAKFRKWYTEELTNNNKGKSPQEIQKNYPDYENLIQSMKEVNSLLVEYANQLKTIVNGK